MFCQRTGLVVLCVLASSFGFAKPPFWKVFVETYHINPNSVIGKAKCLTCHLPPAPPKRNSYGLQVQEALEAAHERMVTPEMLHSIEKKDADGDGFTNITEIKADSLPGDATSKPVKKKRKAVPHTRHKAARGHRKKLALSEESAFALALITLSLGAVGLRRRA